MGTTKGQAWFRGSEAYDKVRRALILAARDRRPLYYKQVAELMGLPISGNNMQRQTGKILGEISEDEVAQGRPMLSAIVERSSGNGGPGDGFYSIAREMGLLQDKDANAEGRFWRRERARVYELWAGKNPPE